jgi:small subunit ribosomal protein S1
MLKKGDEVEAQVLEIDKANQRISLGIKQAETDPWSVIESKFSVGDIVKGTVTKIASFGAFVQLQDDIDGLVHISEIMNERVSNVRDVLSEGQQVKVKVLGVDDRGKVRLSMRVVDQVTGEDIEGKEAAEKKDEAGE